MRPASMHRELREGVRAAADDDGGIVRRALVAKVGPKFLKSALGHDAPPVLAGLARNGARRLSSGARVTPRHRPDRCRA
jgi:hypothetical protein